MYTLIHYVAFLDTEPEKQNQQQVHTTAILLLLLLLVLELCRFKLHPVRCNMYNSLSDCTECLEGCQYIDKDTSYQI